MQASKYEARGREKSLSLQTNEHEYVRQKLKLKTKGQNPMTVRKEKVWETKRRNQGLVCFLQVWLLTLLT